MTKMIDPHGEALDLLAEERYQLEGELSKIKPRIKQLNRFLTDGDTSTHDMYAVVFHGNISTLTKFRNELRRRLANVEATRRLLKEDRADQLEDAWYEEQARIAAEKNMPNKPFLPCGCW